MKLRLAICLLLGLAVLGIAQIPFAASDKYRLSWISDPATTMTIGWRRTSGDAFGGDYHDDWQYTISSDSFWQFRLIQADPSNIYIRTVKNSGSMMPAETRPWGMRWMMWQR